MIKEGTVKWFDEDKGYGFIDVDESDQDAFVHYSEIQMGGYKVLKEGQRVRFEPNQTDKGLSARKVIPEDNTTRESGKNAR